MHLKSLPSSKDQVESVQVVFDAVEDKVWSHRVENPMKMMNQSVTERSVINVLLIALDIVIYTYSIMNWCLDWCSFSYIFGKEPFNTEVQPWIYCCKLHREELRRNINALT